MNDVLKFYEGYKKILDSYYTDLIGERFLNFIKYGFLYLLFMFFPSFFFAKLVLFKWKFLIIILFNIFVLFSYFHNMKVVNKKLVKKMNKKVFNDLLYSFCKNNDVYFSEKKCIKYEFFKDFDLFNYDLLNYQGSNVLKVNYKSNNILCSDVSLFYYEKKINSEIVKINEKFYIKRVLKKKRNYVFKGMYLDFKISKKNDNYIYLIPNSLSDSFLNKFIKRKGSKVVLEDILFNKKYNVYSFDQIKSRYILSIDLMGRINKLDSLIPNKKYIVFKNSSSVGIFISDFSFDSIFDNNIPIKRNDESEFNYVKSIYEKINVIFSIYDLLELNNDLYIFD